MTIGVFYAFGTAVGGIGGPALFGALIESGERIQIENGYLLGGALMLIAAVTVSFLGVRAERRPLEEVARPALTRRHKLTPRQSELPLRRVRQALSHFWKIGDTK